MKKLMKKLINKFKNINLKLLIAACFIAAIFSSITSFSIVHIFKNNNETKQLAGVVSDEPNVYDPDVIKYDASNAVKAPDGIMIYQELRVESGDLIPIIENYFQDDVKISDEASIAYYVNDEAINVSDFTYREERRTFTKGTHTIDVIISIEEKDYTSKLIIYDDQNPLVTFKDITINKGEKVDAEDFIETYSDNSGDKNYNAKINNKSDYSSVGEHAISLTVCDTSDNCVNGSAKLNIKKPNSSGGGGGSGGSGNGGGSGSGGSGGSGSSGGSGGKTPTNGETPKIDPNVIYVSLDEARKAYNDYEQTRQTILNKTNEYRKEVGSAPVTLSYDLCIIAMVRAMEMAYNNDFSHIRPDGTPWYQVYYSYYGVNKNTVGIAENIAMDYQSDNGAMTGWRYSDGHYKSIINSSYKTMGVGKYTYNNVTYWVQIFSA